MKKTFLALTALTLIFASCKKDDNGGTSNKTSIVTTGTWRITSSTSVVEYPAPIGTQNVDLYSILPTCQKDNIFTFNANNTVTTDEGATKCNPSDPQTSTGGSWAFTDNETKFTVSSSSYTVSGDILTLDATTLKLKYVTTTNGITSTTTTTYNH